MNARLPKTLEDRDAIKDMQIGEERWTVPWAMWVDPDRSCWLHPKHHASRTPGGTVQLRIVRAAGGYIVDTTRCPEFRWTPRERVVHVGEVDDRGLPVIELIER